tara:strand:+ start:3259 stop:3462 length:204 start_codon:yes stop_codon:yes gene_type:complete
MKHPIIGFHKDENDDWIAELECGHNYHVRHNPPWKLRPWVISEAGRNKYLGTTLNCLKCERKEPRDN